MQVKLSPEPPSALLPQPLPLESTDGPKKPRAALGMEDGSRRPSPTEADRDDGRPTPHDDEDSPSSLFNTPIGEGY